MAKMKKAYILVEVELADNLEELYPNYRFNFFKRKDFISMIKNEIKNGNYIQFDLRGY